MLGGFAELLRRLEVREAFDCPEDNHLTVFLGKRGQARIEPVADLSAGGLRQRARDRGGELIEGVDLEFGLGLAAPSCAFASPPP